MRIFILILTILFSYSVLADCCSSAEFEENCQIETLKEINCTDIEHSSTDHDAGHCSFTCSSKMIKKPTTLNVSLNFTFDIPYYDYNQSLEGISLSPGLRPPIV